MHQKIYYIHDTTVVDDNVKIGKNTKIWHYSHIQSGAIIGNNCSLGQNVNVGNNVKIGNFVKIQNNVSVYNGVEINDDVFCGPSCVFTNITNPRSFIEQKDKFIKTIVSVGATIGANATIVCGNNIGQYSFIGAGTLVNKDVNDYTMVVGNPCRFLSWVDKRGNRIKLPFDKDSTINLKEFNETYIIRNGKCRCE